LEFEATATVACFEFEASYGARTARRLLRVTSPDSLDADQLAAYFALMEVSSLLRHAVEQQLRADGGLTYVQFVILAALTRSPNGQQRMTELADAVVHSRSGLTYQAEQLEKAGLVTRTPTPDDERSTTVTLTDAGRERVLGVLPGHQQVARDLLLDHLSKREVGTLATMLSRVRDQLRAAPPRSAAARSRRTPCD
jgi:DNA-binding MarR family transcriptional regulator